MRSITIFITAMLLAICQVQAQKPEKIYSFVKVAKPLSYYYQQADLWQKEIKKNKKNANAWLNFYQVKRNIVALNNNSQITIPSTRSPLDSIVDQMAKFIPNTFEYNYVKWYQGGNDFKLVSYLQKAYELAPERQETYNSLLIYNEVKRDTAKRNFFARKLYSSPDASPGLFNYSYNVLAGLEPNAIILTGGDNDTYPIWMLQAAKGFRTDVMMLNLSLLLIDEYRDKVLDELGIPKIKLKTVVNQQDADDNMRQVVKQIAAHSKRPLYLALTAGDMYAEDIKDSLYLTGLALKYSPARFDNLAVLKRNFERNYAIDYLKVSFGRDMSEGIVKMINCNYIVPMLTLYDHYKLSGDGEKAQEVKDLVMHIGAGSEQEQELNKYFQNSQNR